MKTLHKFKLTFFLFLLSAFGFRAEGQIVQTRPIDFSGMFTSGKMKVSINPSYSGDTLKLFDGNQFNALEMVGLDSASITLSFDSPLQIEKTKVFFWHEARWTIETAGSLADLNAKSGSYAKPVNGRSASFFMFDSLQFASQTVRVVRLGVKNPADSSIRIGEWSLEGSVTFVSLLILPQPARLVVGRSLTFDIRAVDDQQKIYPNFLGKSVLWSSSAPSVVTIDEDGKATGIALGTSEISVRNSANTISGKVTLQVLPNFRGTKVKPMEIKVVLVNQNPYIPSIAMKLNKAFGWRDPNALADGVVKHFTEATDSVVNFKIIERVEANILFTRYYGSILTSIQYYNLLKETGWPSLKKASDSGQIYFDYKAFVKYYGYDERRNKGEIDEVWVFAAPYLGMYESQLLGPNAFWWNSPPIKDGTALKKLLSVMGLNYERGVDQAFHSFGHRSESAMRYAYNQVQGKPWNPKSATPTPWDLFTRYDKEVPGLAHVGNIHYPPNGVSDYNYGNTTIVASYAENWYRYPLLFDETNQVNVSTWLYQPGDPLAEGNDHLGYLRWWYGHLPRYEGVTEGILNNWWMYVTDYDSAAALAKSMPLVSVRNQEGAVLADGFELSQNYPNPFNPQTTVSFTLQTASHVTLSIYDALGREIATVADEPMEQGLHSVHWDGAGAATGIYFYRLRTNAGVVTKKMLLLR